MIGATSNPRESATARTQRRSSETSLDFRVSFSGATDTATGRLARKIREAIARTVAREAEGDGRVEVSGAVGEAKPEAEAQKQETPPGCGAWWAF